MTPVSPLSNRHSRAPATVQKKPTPSLCRSRRLRNNDRLTLRKQPVHHIQNCINCARERQADLHWGTNVCVPAFRHADSPPGPYFCCVLSLALPAQPATRSSPEPSLPSAAPQPAAHRCSCYLDIVVVQRTTFLIGTVIDVPTVHPPKVASHTRAIGDHKDKKDTAFLRHCCCGKWRRMPATAVCDHLFLSKPRYPQSGIQLRYLRSTQ